MDSASQNEVEAAALGAITHRIVLVQDEYLPWQPIDVSIAGSGIETYDDLTSSDQTATTFNFSGHGTLHYECALSGGVLEVSADGGAVAVFDEPMAWQSGSIAFVGYGAHEVVFAYTADAAGSTAGLRNVRWVETDGGDRARGASAAISVDFQDGVRVPQRLADVLPFAYSYTNWIGDVTGVSASSVARVAIVQLDGTGPDVATWTTEEPGSYRVLKAESGEGEVAWSSKPGVWKATFDILNNDAGIHSETAIFDLRQARARGFVFYVK